MRNLALVKICIVPDGSNRSNHRQDQSILSILFYKYKEKHNFKDIPYYVNLSPHNKLINKK